MGERQGDRVRRLGEGARERSAPNGGRPAGPMDPREAALCVPAMAVEGWDVALRGDCARLAQYTVVMGKTMN